jgi:DNA-binding CsgD family transcriptional regulator
MTDPAPLSEREKEVLQLVAEGLTNREISQRLSISANTVKVHLRNIFEKTDVTSRTEATVYAIEQRIVAVPGGEAPQPEGRNSYVRLHSWIGIVGLLLIGVLILVVLFAFILPARGIDVDPVTLERWKELVHMPEARVDFAAVAYDNQIYAISGEGPTGISGSVFRYDIETDSWERLPDKPTPVKDIEGVVIGEKIYIPGGEGLDGQPVNTLEIYDPRHNTWEAGAPLPEALSTYTLADFEGKMYLFGGWDGGNAVDTVWEYNPADDVWTKRSNLKEPNNNLKAVSLSDYIVLLVGEYGTSPQSSRAYLYFPSREQMLDNPWEDFNIPSIRLNVDFSLENVNDAIYIIGGEATENDGYSEFSKGYIYVENSWEEFDLAMNIENSKIEIVSEDSFLYVIVTSNDMNETSFWDFQAIYYEIFFPIYDQ